MIKNKKITLCIPCRDEAAHLRKIINKVPDYVDEILIISNRSADNTYETAKSIGGRVKSLKDDRVIKGVGYGYAHMKGIKEASGDIIVGLDGDGTYPLNDIKKIVNFLIDNDKDFISCNRYPLKDRTRIPLKLRLGVKLLNFETKMLYGINIKDILSGMWVFRKRIKSKLELSEGDWNLSPQIKINAATNDDINFSEFRIKQYERMGKTKQKYLRTGWQHTYFLLKNRFSIKTAGSKKDLMMIFLVLALLVGSYFIPILGVIGFLIVSYFGLLGVGIFSIIESFFLSFLLFWISNIVIYSFSTLAGFDFNVHNAPFVDLIVVILIFLINHKRIKKRSYKYVKNGDITAVISFIVTFVVMLIPVYGMAGSQVAQFLSYGEDNASHYALTNYIYKHGAYAYGQNPKNDGLLLSLETYPEGFHVNAAVFLGLVKPHKITTGGQVKVYYIFIALDYSLFILFFIKICIGFIKRKNKLISIAAVPSLILLCSLSLYLLLLWRGFQPQIFGYLFLLASIYVLNMIKENVNKAQIIWLLILSLTLSVGVASSWWLLMPVLAILLVIWGIRYLGLGYTLKVIKKHILWVLTVVFAGSYPILINLLFSTKVNPLDEPGGINILSWSIFYYLLPVILIALPLTIKSIKSYGILYMSFALTSILTIGIGIYQISTVGHLEYYFYKCVYSVLLFYLAIFFVSGFEVAQYLYKKLGKIRVSIPFAILAACIAISISTNLVYAQVYVHNWYPNVVGVNDFNILFSKKISGYQDVYYIGSCNNGRDYLDNRWSGARLLSENELHTKVEMSYIYNNYRGVSIGLQRSLLTKRILLVTYPGCLNKIPNINKILSSPNATIYKSN